VLDENLRKMEEEEGKILDKESLKKTKNLLNLFEWLEKFQRQLDERPHENVKVLKFKTQLVDFLKYVEKLEKMKKSEKDFLEVEKL